MYILLYFQPNSSKFHCYIDINNKFFLSTNFVFAIFVYSHLNYRRQIYAENRDLVKYYFFSKFTPVQKFYIFNNAYININIFFIKK